MMAFKAQKDTYDCELICAMRPSDAMASDILVSIGADNGLMLVRHQAILEAILNHQKNQMKFETK